MKTALAFLLPLVFSFLPGSILFSQAVVADSSGYLIPKGIWSAQFEVGTFINSGSFEAFLVSIKYHPLRQSGIRVGFGFNNSTSTGNDNYDNRDSVRTYPDNSKNLTFNFSADYLFYANPGSIIKMYFGGGPMYKYKKQENTANDIFFNEAGTFENIHKYNSENWSAGLNLVFGVEWFPFRKISLVAEYNSNFLWGKSRTTTDYSYSDPFSSPSKETYTTDQNTSEIDINIVRLGISAYF